MTRSSRRQFLSHSLAALGAGAGACFSISGTKASGRILGANERVRVAVAGLNGRGESHVVGFGKLPNVEVVALIDPDTRTFARRVAQSEELGGRAPEVYQDVRAALDRQDVDALSVATPNHWHALLTIWGCQAGKDVYVEKPCSHNVLEGRMAVEAARKYGRVVQHGTQGRSDSRWAHVAELARAGTLGKLLVARGLCYKDRRSIGVKSEQAAPSELDFNLWLGPASERPFHENLVHYNWHWFWDFGNGDIGNQGVHQMDVARWMIPGATLPTSVVSLGGRFGYEDQGETPNTQIAAMTFGPTLLIFEVRGLPSDAYRGAGVGNVLHFEAGVVTNRAFYPSDSETPAPLPGVTGESGSDQNHFANFIDAVRTRVSEHLKADILEGHYSSALCHLANISYRTGQMVSFDSATRNSGCTELDETFERMVEHLSRKNGLKLEGGTYRMGRNLAFDPSAERFTGPGAEEANALLSRAYRAPFLVPAAVKEL